jgi:hypothetical protein
MHYDSYNKVRNSNLTPWGHVDLFFNKPSNGAQDEKGGIIQSLVRSPPLFGRIVTDCPRV